MTQTIQAVDTQKLRQAFAHHPSGVAALAASVDGNDSVLVASSFTVGVSMEPPLVMFAVQKSSSTWPSLRKAESIGVSILSSQQGTLCRQLAGSDRASRFSGVETERLSDGGIFFSGAAATFHCAVFAEYPAGDHDIIVLQVLAMRADLDSDPLVFHGSRFRHLNK